MLQVNLLENEKGEYGYSVPWTSFEVDIENYRSYISVPQVVEFQTNVEGDTAFANFYPPTNPDYKPLAGEKPPLLVRSHGMCAEMIPKHSPFSLCIWFPYKLSLYILFHQFWFGDRHVTSISRPDFDFTSSYIRRKC